MHCECGCGKKEGGEIEWDRERIVEMRMLSQRRLREKSRDAKREGRDTYEVPYCNSRCHEKREREIDVNCRSVNEQRQLLWQILSRLDRPFFKREIPSNNDDLLDPI